MNDIGQFLQWFVMRFDKIDLREFFTSIKEQIAVVMKRLDGLDQVVRGQNEGIERIAKIFGEAYQRLTSTVETLANKVEQLTQLQEQFMARTQADFDQVISRIDTATDRVAADLRAVKESLKNQGLDENVENYVFGKLDAAATKLEAVGKDEATGGTGTTPTEPTTPAEPTPVEPTEGTGTPGTTTEPTV